MMRKKTLNFGIIGSGFMGRTHVFGIALASRLFELPVSLRLVKIADVSYDAARKAANEMGFEDFTGDWKDLIEDKKVDVINITTPNAFHKEMALEAIKAGKHVYCEKPLATSIGDANAMRKAANRANVKTQVGFNYLCNPMLKKARKMILDGDLGEILGFRGLHAEDYMVSRKSPFTWRHEKQGGGALADLGSHIIATAEFLIGPIKEVMGSCETAIKTRKDQLGLSRDIEVDDITRVFLRFENGATGSLEANWISMGRKMQHDFEVYGSEGAICYSGERLNELLYYNNSDPTGEKGFRTIWAGPDHKPYDRFCVASGHQLGFADLKAIEVKQFVDAITGLSPEPFNFDAGYRIQMLVDLIKKSSMQEKWLAVEMD